MSLKTFTTAFTTGAPHPYIAGLLDGRADAATETPDITAVRKDWMKTIAESLIAEGHSAVAESQYAEGYADGLNFDRNAEVTFRSARRGRP
ncbi:hypothetical protein ACF1AE_21445 [Streptomyces sp. NPDC014986]|uniref:hypothetical protein n=1 Tax=Streptomyces sp. NPDC014986 TaxID=3364934 RepID=UPI0036FDF0BE